MNADGSANVAAELSVGARVPHLLLIALIVLGAGLLMLVLGGIGLYLAVPRGGD